MTTATVWDEPQNCSARGWLMRDGTCVGFYLDYGPDHYRSPHSSVERVLNGPKLITWCRPDSLCRDCQPGNILAVRYPGGPGTASTSRYCETVAEARGYIVLGAVPSPAASAA